MTIFLSLFLSVMMTSVSPAEPKQESPELKIVQELFRLRNEQKADSAEQYFADTVKVYMKYLRNIPKQTITKLDRSFFKAHPRNKFEITTPVQLTRKNGITTAIIIGKEYLDGTNFNYERIEIKFNHNRKINYFRAFNWKK
ncbi:MAG: hypothetical protein SGI83_01050 [Bacteroidota bacterium]|nr:hypothetical protein [Bacteroidota bacterium]